jgi:hypothetical protein
VSYRRATGRRPAVRITPPEALARDAPSLARSAASRVPAGAMTSPGPATLAVSAVPGTPRAAAVTMAAGPAPAWIRMCEAIT